MAENSVKERPILFSGPMVRAILAGKKTKTRRIAKLPLPLNVHSPMAWAWSDRKKLFEPVGSVGHLDIEIKWGVKCPYGNVGDRLWVRETWQSLATMNQCHRVDDRFVYRASDPDWSVMEGWQWRPSIFMPRRACRIMLQIESIQVERLQAITEDEAIAEGAQCAGFPASLTNRGAFASLWNKINGAGSWESNPFVWVVGFSRVAHVPQAPLP